MASASGNILVTGGAGYIGSHCVQQLRAEGRHVVVLDNLSTGHERFLLGDAFVQASTHDTDTVRKALTEYDISAVLHFAASCYVGESVEDPDKYYYNNIEGTRRLLAAMRESGINRFIFSSSCAVYGDPLRLPLTEEHPFHPINPYGFTKRVVEEMLKDYSQAYGLRYVALRYFNAAGADPSGRLGEAHEPETHLIPLVLQVASGRRDHISVFGTDYDTRDGTCVRDYIHIHDLAKAHLLSLEYLEAGGTSDVFNLGTEHGYTVREIIDACERITGRTVKVIEGPRRPGDPPALVAGAAKARTILGWQPDYQSLDRIIETAWAWECREAGLESPV